MWRLLYRAHVLADTAASAASSAHAAEVAAYVGGAAVVLGGVISGIFGLIRPSDDRMARRRPASPDLYDTVAQLRSDLSAAITRIAVLESQQQDTVTARAEIRSQLSDLGDIVERIRQNAESTARRRTQRGEPA